MTIFIYIALYVLGIFGFITYEALVGFSDIDFDGEQHPPAWLIGMFWLLAIPILMIYSFSERLSKAKRNRLEVAKEKLQVEEDKRRLIRKLRIEQEDAVRKAEQELELESMSPLDKRYGKR